MNPSYQINVHRTPDERCLGAAAGAHAARLITQATRTRGSARVMLAAAPSQLETLRALAAAAPDFSSVTFFQLDDYLGLRTDAPQGFGTWLIDKFLRDLPGAPRFHRIRTEGDPESAAAEYAAIMGDEPFDLTLCGLGVNGHLAFNEPPADFTDQRSARVVSLDEISRRQQVDEGHFAGIDDVPGRAITVTIPRLLNAVEIICSVPGTAKRAAVRDTLAHGPDPAYPGTALKLHGRAHLYLDADSSGDG